MGNTFREKIVEEGLTEPQQEPQQPTEGARNSKGEASGTATSTPKPKSKKPSKNYIGKFLGGEFLKGSWVKQSVPFLAIIVAFWLLAVSNRYRVEKLTKEKIKVEDNIKYIREKRLQTQKEYQESVKISRIANELDSVGVGLIAGPPYEINVNEKEIYKPKADRKKR